MKPNYSWLLPRVLWVWLALNWRSWWSQVIDQDNAVPMYFLVSGLALAAVVCLDLNDVCEWFKAFIRKQALAASHQQRADDDQGKH